MGNTSSDSLKKSQRRRKRVARMKIGILMTVFIWMIASIVIIAYLLVQISSLKKEMNYLTEHFTIDDSYLESNASGTVVAQNDEPYDDTEKNTEEYDFDTSFEENYPIANAVGFSDNLISEGETPLVYLTFDDGPSDNTSEILDILDEYGVKATFFVIGKTDDESMALYKRIVDEGHTLGMHSYSHKYSEIYASVESFKEDFSKIQNLLYEATGEECLFYRFPGGSSNQVNNDDMSECISYLNSLGITYFDWNVSNGDATSQVFTSEELVENVMADVVKYKTSVVLMHDADEKDTTVESLPKLIEQLQGIDADILPIDSDTTVIQHIAATSVE